MLHSTTQARTSASLERTIRAAQLTTGVQEFDTDFSEWYRVPSSKGKGFYHVKATAANPNEYTACDCYDCSVSGMRCNHVIAVALYQEATVKIYGYRVRTGDGYRERRRKSQKWAFRHDNHRHYDIDERFIVSANHRSVTVDRTVAKARGWI